MSGNIWVANTTEEVLLAASSQKTLIRITTPASAAILIKEWGVFFDGILSTSPPVLVSLAVDTTGETGMTSHTPKKRRGFMTASQCVVQTLGVSCAINSSAIYAVRNVHPQSGYQEKFAYGDEILVGGTSGTISLRVNSPTSVYALGEIVFEE